MATTARDLISASMRLVGILASGESADAAMANDALVTLNNLLGVWSLDKSLAVYTMSRAEYTLTISAGTYTIGPSGTGVFAASVRPTRIESAAILSGSGVTATETPITILDAEGWAGIATKAATAVAIPTYLYYDKASLSGNLTLYPTPSAANKLVLYTWNQFTEFATLSTDITLPPGYFKALQYQLAIELSLEYGRPLDPAIPAISAEAIKTVKALNVPARNGGWGSTVWDIIKGAMRLLGPTMPPPDANDMQNGLKSLNLMLSHWSNQELMVYSVNRDLYSLVAGTQSYTLGVGGTFNAARPVRIDRASVQINTGALPLEIPLHILTDEDWRDLSIKTVPSTFPTKMWITGNYPLNTLYFWPVPQDSTVKVILYTWAKLGSFADLQTAVALPEGYERAIRLNLAVELAPEYGIQLDPGVVSQAIAAKATLEDVNIEPLYSSSVDMFSSRATAISTFGYQVDR